MNPDDIRTAVATHVESAEVPRADLGRVRSLGRRLRRRRRTTIAGVVAAAAWVAVTGGLLATSDDDPEPDTAIDAIGRLDYSGGLRAFASADGVELHLGGRTFTDQNVQFLDTDAVATDAGLLFYRNHEPYLLEESGQITRIDRSEGNAPEEFHPTAKADPTASQAAYALPAGLSVTVVVYDLAAREREASQEFPCGGDCDSVVIDALDGGNVFVRTSEGTQVWDSESGSVETFSTGDTRVADVRNGVVLYDGPAPQESPVTQRWRLVSGAIDAQLTFDGAHVLSWSSRLEPTTPGGRPIVLERPEAGNGYAFWNVDTDGSIMVAVPDAKRADVFDCAVPSGSCTRIGDVSSRSGDPMFIGNDM